MDEVKYFSGTKVPKRIFGYWFGNNPIPALNRACVESWGSINKDCEIQLVTDFSKYSKDSLARRLYESKQYAFLTDYLRLKDLYENGGVYADVDVEFIRPISSVVHEKKTIIGYETKGRPNGAVIISPKGSEFIKMAMTVIVESVSSTSAQLIMPEVLMRAVSRCSTETYSCLPQEVFYPYNPYDVSRDIPQLMWRDIKANTIAVHHFTKNWSMPLHMRLIRSVSRLKDFFD